MNSPSRWEWWVGTRYLRSTHRRGFVSFVAAMSVTGLTLGVAVLIVVLSVMNGFERELRSRILAVTSHATLMGLEGTLDDWQQAREVAVARPGVLQAVPYIEARGMIAAGPRVQGALVHPNNKDVWPNVELMEGLQPLENRHCIQSPSLNHLSYTLSAFRQFSF